MKAMWPLPHTLEGGEDMLKSKRGRRVFQAGVDINQGPVEKRKKLRGLEHRDPPSQASPGRVPGKRCSMPWGHKPRFCTDCRRGCRSEAALGSPIPARKPDPRETE